MIKNTIKIVLASLLFFTLLFTSVNAKADNFTDVNDLPTTTGSFYKDEGTMGTASFEVYGSRVVARIRYESKTYSVNFYLQNDTDMDVFIKYREVYYYTDNNDPYLVINNGNYDFFREDGTKHDTFNPHIIWNLKTNELQNFDRFTTYIHMELEKANNLYAYFYVDEFLIDDLLNISLRYQYKYINLFGNSKGDWIEQALMLENTNYAITESTSWQMKYIVGAATVSAAALAIPGIGLPIAAVGTAVTALMALYASDHDGVGFRLGKIEEIEKISGENNKVRGKLNNLYYTIDSTFDGINKGYNIFKLHLGQFNKPLTKGIEVNQEYSYLEHQEGLNIIQFTYMTRGEQYLQKGANINVKVSFGDGTVIPDKDDRTSILKLLIALAVVLLLAFAGIRSGAFRDGKSALKFLVAVLILGVVFILIFYGIVGGFGTKLFNVLLL